MPELLKLTFFGAPQISLNGRSLNSAISGKHLALLVYLATTGQVHMRDVVADLLWSEMSNTQALKNLRDVVADLRKVVGDHLEITRQTLAFAREQPHWLDVEVFRTHVLAEATTARPPLLHAVLDLYQRDFVAGFAVRNAPVFEEWVVWQREQLRGLAVQALDLLGDRYLADANYEAGLTINQRWLALDPESEAAHYQRMRLLAASGQRSAALTQYELCRRLLDEEFGVAPAAETTAFYDELKSGGLERVAARPGHRTLANGSAPPQRMALPLEGDELPKSTLFCGRQSELAQLQTWLLDDGCRVVGIFGMGGQGKTTLAAQLVRMLTQTQRFERVLWRSLLNAPPLAELLPEWLRLISDHQITQIPVTLEEQLTLFFAYLEQRPALLVLDNIESILQPAEPLGAFRPGYAAYGQLIEWLGSRRHAAALLLTGRESTPGFGRLEQDLPKVRSLQLAGLPAETGQELLLTLGIAGNPAAISTLSDHYSGNPLALKLVATTVRDFFAGDLTTFLEDKAVIFDDIRQVLDQHFARLSPLEETILFWLAVERVPIVFPTLWADLAQPPPRPEVLEALRSLQRRSLVECIGDGFGLQNVVMEYITGRLIDFVVHELVTGELQRFNSHALMKAQAKEYVRKSQERMILQPVAQGLVQQWGRGRVAPALRQVLERLRVNAGLPGYAAANILHLLLSGKHDLRGYDFSGLPVWQADLRRANLAQVNFAGVDLKGSTFTEPLETIRSLCFSPDGHFLATGAEDGEVRLWRLSDRQPTLTLTGHTGPIRALAFSRDGTLLASASSDRTLRLWDLEIGAVRHVLLGNLDEVLTVQFIADDDQLLSIGQDGAVWRWPVNPTGAAVGQLLFYATSDGQARFTMGVAINQCTGLLATTGADTVVRCWDFATGQLQYCLKGHTDMVSALGFRPDGKLLVSCSKDNTVRLWPMESQRGMGLDPQPQLVLQRAANQVSFSANGRILFAGRGDLLWIWDTEHGRFLQQMSGHASWLSALDCHPSGQLVASASFDQTVCIWDVGSGWPDHTLIGLSRWMDHVQFSPDGTTLASSQFDHTVHLWRRNGQYRHALTGHQGNVRALAYSPDGQHLATGSDDAMVRLWEVQSGKLLATLRGHTDVISALVFSPDGRQLISGSHSVNPQHPTTVSIWDVGTGTLRRFLPRPVNRAWWLAFHPDGVRLAIASADQTVLLWDLQADELLYVLEGHSGIVRTLAFHPGGRWLASGGDDRTIRLWDVAAGALFQTLTGHSHTVSYLAFTPTGDHLVSASMDQTVRIWVRAGECGQWQLRHTLAERLFKFNSIALSPDGTTLVSGSLDTNVHVWDVQSGQKRHTLRGHTTLVTAVHISPDGSQAVSSSGDGTLRLWEIHTGVCLDVLRTQGPYTSMNITGVRGINLEQRTALKALGAIEC